MQNHEHVILMNPFQVNADQENAFFERWRVIADFMKRQAGFIDTTLHKATDNSGRWFNYARWRSSEDFRNAIATEEFRRLTANFPAEGKPCLYSVVTTL